MKRNILLLLALVGASGCGYNIANEPPATVKVTGKVVMPNGQPLTIGKVRFEPTVAGQGAEAHADLGSGGTFTVKSFGSRDGIRPGSYVAYIDPATVTVLDAASKKMVLKPAAAGIPTAFLKAETSRWKIEITDASSDLGTLKLQ